MKITFDEDDHCDGNEDVEDDNDDNGDSDLPKVPEPWVTFMLYGYLSNPTLGCDLKMWSLNTLH